MRCNPVKIIRMSGDLVGMTFLATGFQQSDQDTSGTLIACLDAIRSHPFFRLVKEESFDLLQVTEGMRLLEIGCGTGADAWKLAGMTGRSGLVAAIDPSLVMLKSAQDGTCTGQKSDSAPLRPAFMRMDGRDLAFFDSVFDCVREDRALQHIMAPERVISEMLRVLKPDGAFILFEPDWELFTIDAPDRLITRKILNFWSDQFMNGWIGRELFRICMDCGAIMVSAYPRTMVLHDLEFCEQIFGIMETVNRTVHAGIITSEEAAAWLSSISDADRAGKFFCSFTGYLVKGRKKRSSSD